MDTGKRLGGFIYFEKPFEILSAYISPKEDIQGKITPVDKETAIEVLICDRNGEKLCSKFYSVGAHIGTIIITKGTLIPLSC